MVTSPVQFAGLKDFLVRKQDSTKSKKIYSLTPEALEASKTASPCGVRGYKVQLTHDSFAYIHPREQETAHRIGAHKLAKLLQFDISPQVKALEIPNELNCRKAQSIDPYGTIMDWVEGPTFNKFKQMPESLYVKYDLSNLIELYFFHLIAQDADSHQLNIIVQIPEAQKGTVKLFSIDNEMAASTPTDFIKRLNKYPEELKAHIQGKPIPKDIKDKLQQFLDNQVAGTKKLQGYFPAEAVENAYKIAQFLIEHQTVPTQPELISYLDTLSKEQSNASLFKHSSGLLEKCFSSRPTTPRIVPMEGQHN